MSHSFSKVSAELCQTNAEWIVEDFAQGSDMVPFANFGTVSFTGCSVSTTSGSSIGVEDAELLDIRQNTIVRTDCSTAGSSTVSCKFV